MFQLLHFSLLKCNSYEALFYKGFCPYLDRLTDVFLLRYYRLKTLKIGDVFDIKNIIYSSISVMCQPT